MQDVPIVPWPETHSARVAGRELAITHERAYARVMPGGIVWLTIPPAHGRRGYAYPVQLSDN